MGGESFAELIAESDVTDEDINRCQIEVLHGRGAMKKEDRLEVSRTLGVLRAILSTARATRPSGDEGAGA